ncbi:retrovirus-related pol polyprotein from transposon TNT 1-94 [Tanacetum coccineum]
MSSQTSTPSAPLAGPKPADMTDAKYNPQDKKAHSTILLSLPDEVLYEVADEETAAGVWKKLEKLYMTKSLTNKLLLKQRLFSLRMKEGSALKDHLDALNSILMDLKNVEVKIDNEDAALILLVSLPPSFENFVNSFVVGKDTITLEDVRSGLHSRELRHQASGISESQPVGLSITSQDRGRHRTQRGKGKGRYKDRSKSRSQTEKAAVAKMSRVRNETAGSFSCCLKFDGGHVFMGNDSPCKVVGIGTIRIKMHDGVVRTLTDVRHVPDLKKNLISLGVLDSKGFKYRSENGVLRVSKGALVVMKATKGTSSLYTLQGETIIGSDSVSCLEKSNSDLTKLWHMRLGHMSEKGMVILSKRGLLDNHKVANLEFCEHCVIGKQKRVSFSKSIHQTKGTLDYLHANCWGPSRVPSLGGARSPATAIDCETPIEVWSGKPADYSKLHVFGCPVYYHVSEGKLDPRGKKGIFMGYGEGVKGYRIWSPSERRVILSRDVTFDEDYLFRVKQDPIESKLQDGVSGKVEDDPKQMEHVVPGDMNHDDTSPDDHINLPHLEYEQDRSIAHDRPHRNVKAPTRFGDYVTYALQVAKEVESLEPATYREAITSKDSDIWIAAIGEEIESLHKNKTRELV